MTEKPSVSGLMSQSHEVNRFENLFFKAVGTAYYNLKWGLDWEFWLSPEYALPINSFVSYLTQDATVRGIIIDEITADIENFTLTLNVTIEGVEFITVQTLVITE